MKNVIVFFWIFAQYNSRFSNLLNSDQGAFFRKNMAKMAKYMWTIFQGPFIEILNFCNDLSSFARKFCCVTSEKVVNMRKNSQYLQFYTFCTFLGAILTPFFYILLTLKPPRGGGNLFSLFINFFSGMPYMSETW